MIVCIYTFIKFLDLRNQTLKKDFSLQTFVKKVLVFRIVVTLNQWDKSPSPDNIGKQIRFHPKHREINCQVKKIPAQDQPFHLGPKKCTFRKRILRTQIFMLEFF